MLGENYELTFNSYILRKKNSELFNCDEKVSAIRSFQIYSKLCEEYRKAENIVLSQQTRS